MNFFANLKVKLKLLLVVLVSIIFIILIGEKGVSSADKINEGSKSIYSTNLVSIKNLTGIRGNLNEIRANMIMIVFERDKSKLDEQIKTIDDLKNKDVKLEEEYEKLSSTLEEDKSYNDYK